MPTLEEMQRWALGEPVEGIPEKAAPESTNRPARGVAIKASDIEHDSKGKLRRKRKRGIDPDKMAKRASGGLVGKYKINEHGDDAILKFGKHTGLSVSTIHRDDAGYLDWMIRELDMPADLCDVINHVRRARVSRADARRSRRAKDSDAESRRVSRAKGASDEKSIDVAVREMAKRRDKGDEAVKKLRERLDIEEDTPYIPGHGDPDDIPF